MSNKKKRTFQAQAEQQSKNEALGIAKGIQTPAQTKEQTRLIAQGIEKGIALYKKQENEKIREREKRRKKRAQRTVDDNLDLAQTMASGPKNGEFKIQDARNPPLVTAGLVFSLMCLLHLTRYLQGLNVIVGTMTIPLFWSLPAAAVSAVLAGWMFRSARRSML